MLRERTLMIIHHVIMINMPASSISWHHHWNDHHVHDVSLLTARWWHHMIIIMIHDDVVITLQSVIWWHDHKMIIMIMSWNHWLQGDHMMWSSWIMMMTSSPCSQHFMTSSQMWSTWSWCQIDDCKVMTTCDHNHESWWWHHHLAVSNLMTWSWLRIMMSSWNSLTARGWHHVIIINIHYDVMKSLTARWCQHLINVITLKYFSDIILILACKTLHHFDEKMMINWNHWFHTIDP